MFKRIHISKHERGLLFRHGDLLRVLKQGTHTTFLRRDRVEKVDMLKTRFEHPLFDVLVRDPKLADELVVVDLADAQRALGWKDERMLGIFGPGRYAFWREPAAIRVEVYDVQSFRLVHPKLQAILAFPGASTWLEGVMVTLQSDTVLVFEEHYDNYREVDGVPFPGRFTGIILGEKAYEYFLPTIEYGVELPDSIFTVMVSDTSGIER